MSMLEWNHGLETDVESIDAQHKRLTEIVNSLHDGMLSDKAGFPILNIIGELKDYTVYHFSTEEEYMDEFDYPDANAHKLEHKGFVEKVVQVEADCKSGKLAISMDILNYLSSWLVTHILGTDKRLGDYLRSKGVQ